LAARLRELSARRETPVAAAKEEVAAENPPVQAETVAPSELVFIVTTEPEPARATPAPIASIAPPTAVVTSSAALIDLSLAALDSLTSAPWLEQEEIPEETIVPIESLLYRGTAALDRAIEIRDEIRRADSPGDTDALEELFDLLELARAE
jgi:hypothetical protein